jgi:hypothetical protein
MVEFDAFAGGIVIGGLRNMLEIKILVCYTLSSVDMPITRNQLCDSLQQTGLVNYFDANTAIDELLESESVFENEEAGVKYLEVAPKGRNSARELENTLLPGVREKAVKAAISIAKRARFEKENNAVINKTENGYDVVLEIEDAGVKYFSLTLNVPDILQAEQLRDGFLNDPGNIYSTVIDSLIN